MRNTSLREIAVIPVPECGQRLEGRPLDFSELVCQYSSRHTKWPRDPLLSWFDLRELARLRFDPFQCT
jgi:hypothetical protein